MHIHPIFTPYSPHIHSFLVILGLRNFSDYSLEKIFWRAQLKNSERSGTRTADHLIRSHWPNQLGYRGVHADFWFHAALIPDPAVSTMYAVLYTILISQFRARILPQTKLSHASEGCRCTGAYLGSQASKPGAAKQRLKVVCRDAWQNWWHWRNWRNGDEEECQGLRVHIDLGISIILPSAEVNMGWYSLLIQTSASPRFVYKWISAHIHFGIR